MRALLALALAIAAAVATSAAAPAGAASVHSDLQGVNRFVSVEMDKHRIPGVAVGIIGGNGVVDVAGYGSAAPGRPMTADTPIDIGSMTKMFTAAAITQLVERGEVDQDGPVAHLPAPVLGGGHGGIEHNQVPPPAEPHQRTV